MAIFEYYVVLRSCVNGLFSKSRGQEPLQTNIGLRRKTFFAEVWFPEITILQVIYVLYVNFSCSIASKTADALKKCLFQNNKCGVLQFSGPEPCNGGNTTGPTHSQHTHSNVLPRL